jgi:hypothetical protein
MQIVESTLRPPRIALAIKQDASNRVLKRIFRLLGGKWGGLYDFVIIFNSDGSIDRFWGDLLASADPDFVFVIDPRLGLSDVEKVVSRSRLQPFEVIRLKERQERRGMWRSVFMELPTSMRSHEKQILDYDQGDADWKAIAFRGLPHWNTQFEKVNPRDEVEGNPPDFPVKIGRLGLTGQPRGGPTWCLIGGTDDPLMACRYWSLRAVGRTPRWLRAGAIHAIALRAAGRNVILYAPEAEQGDIDSALQRWSSRRKRVSQANDGAAQSFPRNRQYLASQMETVAPFDGFWRVALPSVPPLQDDYSPGARCIAEFKLLSPNPEDPDGIILAPTETSRELVSEERLRDSYRITRRGVARLSRISKAGLVSIPHIGYREAVNAAFAEYDFALAPSDKGLYQQRSLQLAKGLRFLAWMLRRPESRRLLKLFFEYHLKGRAPAKYRRAVRYEELEEVLLGHLREMQGSLRGPWKRRAQEWLGYWIDGLLERGLLIGGHVLRCPVCADRSFYRLEALGQSFECRRCLATSPLPGNTPRCFQLNEALFELLEHDGEVTTLTLAMLRESASFSFLYLPEIVVSRDGLTRELDIAALVDGELVIGEVKSNKKLTKKEVRNSRFVAKNARAGRMLFATTAKQEEHCAAGDCEACITKYGAHHADRAWGPEVRKEIQRSREILRSDGVQVESLCWHSVHGDQEEKGPLARFKRY